MLVVNLLQTRKELKNLCKHKTHIYKYDLDKACFQHDMTYGKYKDLTKRTQSHKVLRDNVFRIASNPKHNGHLRALASMVYKLFDKKSASLSDKSAAV